MWPGTKWPMDQYRSVARWLGTAVLVYVHNLLVTRLWYVGIGSSVLNGAIKLAHMQFNNQNWVKIII